MKKEKTLEHVVVRTNRLPMGRGKCTDFSGMQIGYFKVIRAVGFNYKDLSVYLLKDIFGEEFNICSSSLRRKEFGHKFYVKESIQKAVRLGKIHFYMVRRCYDPSHTFYKYYGGKDIKVCDEWLGENGRENFIHWAATSNYDHTLTLDRTDSSLDYSPDNCSWMSHKDNVRKSKSAKVTLEKVNQIREEFKNLPSVRGSKTRFFERVALETGCCIGSIKCICYEYNWN